MKDIEFHRGIQKIKPAYHVLKRNKEANWCEIEYLDVNRHKLEKLLSRERSAASKASKKAETLCAEFRSALAAWARSARHRENMLPHEQYYIAFDVGKGASRALAERRQSAEFVLKPESWEKAHEQFPDLFDPREGTHFNFCEFFNFKIIYAPSS